MSSIIGQFMHKIDGGQKGLGDKAVAEHESSLPDITCTLRVLKTEHV